MTTDIAVAEEARVEKVKYLKEIEGAGCMVLADAYRYEMDKAIIFKTIAPNPKAEIALELIAKWGMVAGIDSGEDSTGRSKHRLQSPEELVERACQTAELAFASLEQRGWLLKVPAPTVS